LCFALWPAGPGLGGTALTIEVRLFATLREYLPASDGRTSAQVDVPARASVADVLAKLGIPVAMASLILVDGRHESDKRRKLDDGCVLSVWPHIGGG
ncbi:MAG: MoaD/ThiS family protein, partial [Phycisphaerales bacterium]